MHPRRQLKSLKVVDGMQQGKTLYPFLLLIINLIFVSILIFLISFLVLYETKNFFENTNIKICDHLLTKKHVKYQLSNVYFCLFLLYLFTQSHTF